MNIVIIGSGNVANVIARLIVQKGHSIIQIAGRNKKAVESLANDVNAKTEIDFKNIDTDADLYIIAVSDSAVAEVANKLQLTNKIIVHTAGAVSKDVLRNVSKNYGVLYPIQSLKKEIDYIPEIPLIIDGNSYETKMTLLDFARGFSKTVLEANDETRLKLHAGAVITSNFTNYMFVLTKSFCDSEKIDFNLLLPLIKETVQRLHKYNPIEMQTGPALRGDIVTIEKHLQILKEYPALKNIYKIMSENILEHKKY